MRSDIRQVIQEEIRRASISTPITPTSTGTTPRTNDLINRTRNLINNSAASAVEQFNRNPSRHVPNHLNRLLTNTTGKAKKRKLEAKIYTHELQVLKKWQGPSCSDDSPPNYGIEDSSILIRQVLLDLNNNMKEDEIREKIVNACKNKIPDFTSNSFEFVKRERNKICTPPFDGNLKFDYSQVKKLLEMERFMSFL